MLLVDKIRVEPNACRQGHQDVSGRNDGGVDLAKIGMIFGRCAVEGHVGAALLVEDENGSQGVNAVSRQEFRGLRNQVQSAIRGRCVSHRGVPPTVMKVVTLRANSFQGRWEDDGKWTDRTARPEK